MCMCTIHMSMSVRARGIGSPGARDIGDGELLEVGAGT